MSSFLPAYVLTVMAPPSGSGDNENTPLTPGLGAPHQNPFKLSTLGYTNVNGDTNWFPYLNSPTGRKGTLDVISGITTYGNITCKLQDQRLSTSNLQRFVTAFISVMQTGLRAVVLESTDDGATWTPFFVGRVSDYTLSDILNFTITIKEESRVLDWMQFVGRPSVSASTAAQQSVIPIGLTSQYSFFSQSLRPPMSGSIGPAYTSVSQSYFQQLTIAPDSRNAGSMYNVLSDGMRALFTSTTKQSVLTQSGSGNVSNPYGSVQYTVRDLVYVQSGSAPFVLQIMSGGLTGEYAINSFLPLANYKPPKVGAVIYNTMSGSNPRYFGLNQFPTGSQVKFRVIPGRLLPASNHNPVLVSDVYLPTFVNELLTGYYGYLDNNGVPLKSIAVDTGSINALNADPQVPRVRFNFTQPTSIKDVLQKYVAPLGYGYRFEPTGSNGYYYSRFVLFSNLIPTSSVGLPTITDADVNDVSKTTWQIGLPISTITLKTYAEQQTNQSTIKAGGTSFNHWLVDEVDVTEYDLNLLTDAITVGQNFNIDGLGIRWSDGAGPISLISSSVVTQPGYLIPRIFNYYNSRFATAGAKLTLDCRRSSNTNTLQVGQFVLVEASVIPDSTTNARGGTRLVQIIERQENGPHLTFKFQDCGQNVIAPTPTITQPLLDSGSNIYMTITSQPSTRVMLQYAQENIGSSQPNVSSSDWHNYSMYDLSSINNVQATFWNPLEGQRYYFRCQALYTGSAASQSIPCLPSPWASASVSYLDIAALVSASVLAVSVSDGATATMYWNNNGDSGSHNIISLACPTGTVMQQVATMLPQTSQYTFYNLPNGTNAVGVTHLGPHGGTSLISTMSFSITGALTQALPVVNVQILTSPTFTNPITVLPPKSPTIRLPIKPGLML